MSRDVSARVVTTRPESDDLTHDWHIDGEHSTATSLMYWCPDCLSMCHTRLDALCPDRVKRAMDRRFLAGVRAGLEAAAQECERIAAPHAKRVSETQGQVAVAHTIAEAGPLACAVAIRAIDPTTLTEKP